MKLTVLGNYGPYPKAGGACSGYLVEEGDTKVLLDCGNGILSRLLKVCEIKDINAIALSHLHIDHVSDMLILDYAIEVKQKRGEFSVDIPVYTAQDDDYIISKIKKSDSFSVHGIKESEKIEIGDLTLEFKRNDHPVESYAIKISNDKKSIVYSGDTSYDENLIEFIKGSDLFLCEAGLIEADIKENSQHMSAKQAALLAKQAGIKRLVLTHFWPEYRVEDIMDEALEVYDAILEISQEMKSYYI